MKPRSLDPLGAGIAEVFVPWSSYIRGVRNWILGFRLFIRTLSWLGNILHSYGYLKPIRNKNVHV